MSVRRRRYLHANIAGFADDALQVADALGIDEFGLIGLSGGGPYVLAVAHHAPDRVHGGVVLGGVAPATGPDAAAGGMVDLTRRLRAPIGWARPLLGHGLTTAARVLRPVSTPAIKVYARFSPEGDRVAFAAPGMQHMFTDDLNRGAAGQGLWAAVADLQLFGRPWGFSMRDIEVPIRFWHGDADHIVPLDHAEHMVDLVPDAELTVRPGESHLGTLLAGDAAVAAVRSLADA